MCLTSRTDGLAPSVRQFLGGSEGLNRLSGLGWSDLRIFRELYWRELRDSGLAPDGRILVDRQPDNIVKLPLITKLFPEAKILVVTRDPRDVILSCYRSHARMDSVNYEFLTLEGVARFFDAAMRLTETFRTTLPLTMLEIPYETLVGSFRNSVLALYRYIGLNHNGIAWDALERAKNLAIARSAVTKITSPSNSDGIGSWKRYADRIAPVTPILQPWIDRHGARAT
jgi:hypothetical protein